jgi:hypothetical protein
MTNSASSMTKYVAAHSMPLFEMTKFPEAASHW